MSLGGTFLSANHDTDNSHESGPDEGYTRGDERRRVARELHDSTSQLFVVLQLQLRQLSALAHPEAGPLIDECRQTIDDVRQHIRALNLDQR